MTESFDDIEARHRLIEQEINDTLKHWHRLLMKGYEDDVEACINQPGFDVMRDDLTSTITCCLTFTLHGYNPLKDRL